jgi:L-alanine-DL-glutamate epimerase-like enolase superfamily enzyme
MEITRLETLAAPAGGYRDFLVCRVHTDEGIVGIGEPYPVGPHEAVAAAIRDFESWIVGRDPRDITGIWHHLYAHSRFPGGSVVNAAISVAPHNPCGPLATAVNVHFAAGTHNFLILEYAADDRSPRRDVLREPIRLRHGYLDLPTAPGLGVELNEEFVRPDRPMRNWPRAFAVRPDGAPAFI